MKILIYPKNIQEIEKTKHLVDGYIIGIKDMSVNANMYIEDLTMLKDINKDVFIALNKNMHNSDLQKVKQILIDLNNYNIDP